MVEDAEAKRAVKGMMNEMSFIMGDLDQVSVYASLGLRCWGIDGCLDVERFILRSEGSCT